MSRLARPVAAIGALIGLFGLVLQYWLLYADMSAQGASVFEITWRYFVWFTLLTNTFVTLVMARAALKPESLAGLNAPRIELMAVTSILFVCIVYNLLLASRWDPQGWQKVADVIVHDIVPVTFVLFWLVRPHGTLTLRHAAFAALWPLAYAVYGLTRGLFDNFYPYFFMDPTTLSYGQIALNLVGLVVAFGLGALLLLGISRVLGSRKP
ncbi:Pr6Pr family membrane protein [Candidatus Viadribacter manganicus]|uniref:Pr6Pr family membrane protein n=1 Tax=Candidatus Viadribacter manganicus TaxID=1759059 RepID=UPI0012EAA3CE|nr:Pr6Pr family membrane protein [Candidatus Viadribacter manganicus]